MVSNTFNVRKGLIVANTLLTAENSKVGVNTASPSVTLHIASNDAVILPVGNTADRPTAANGMIRYNSDTNSIEVHANGSWGSISGPDVGGAYFKGNDGTSGDPDSKNKLYRINANTQSNNITIADGENAITVGPMVIADGFNLTIETGGRAVII